MARGEAGDVGGFEKAAGEEAADEEAGGVGGIYEAAGEDVAGEEAGGVGGFEEAAGLPSGEGAGEGRGAAGEQACARPDGGHGWIIHADDRECIRPRAEACRPVCRAG